MFHGSRTLAEGLRDGLTSETGRVEAWPVELSFQCVTLWDKMNVAAEMFTRAADKADQWAKVLAACPAARAFGQAVLSAPLVVPQSQSVLHLWCALESLFPSVSAELSFRVALYLSQMTTTGPDRKRCFEKVKKGYNVRSRIAHGAKQEVTVEEWCDAWGIVTDTLDAVMRNGKVPKEDAILDGLFGIQ